MDMSAVRRALIPLVAVLAGFALPASAPAVEPGIVQSERYDAATEVSTTSAIGARWVRLFVTWNQMQPDPPAGGCGGLQGNSYFGTFKQRATDYAAAGVKVLTVVQFTPAWANGGAGYTVPPTNVQDYADFVKCLAQAMGDKVSAYEVWNEPDDKVFWHNGPQPDKYAALLRATYDTVKPAAPGVQILVGGLVGNNFDFLGKLYANGAKGKFDAVGLHTDTACLVREPEFYYREPDGRIGRFSFTAYREVFQTMRDNGDEKPIWMTEIGWSTLTSECAHPGVTEKRPSGVKPEVQADFLRRAYACMAADPYVQVALWFSLVDPGTSGNYDHHLGLMNHDFTPKPSFDLFRDLFAGGKFGVAANPGCGAKVDRDKPTAAIKVPSQYFTRFSVEGSATDPTTPISRIELWVDGKRIEGMNVDSGTYKKDWFGSTNLSLGKHKVELRAYDEAQNVGIAAAEVTKVNAKNAARTVNARVTFTARKKAGRRILINARVLKALTGDFTEQPKGRMQIFVERNVGRKWKPTSRFTKGIAKKIVINYKAKKPGKWRVYGRLAVDAPYKNVRTKHFQFKL